MSDPTGDRGIGKNWQMTGDYEPPPEHIAWAEDMVRTLKNGAHWGVPATGDTCKIDHEAKTLDLIQGELNDWFFKTVVLFAKIGYIVRDLRGKAPVNFKLHGNVLMVDDDGNMAALDLGPEEPE